MPTITLFGRNYNMVLMPDGQYWADENLAVLNYGSGDTATFYNGSTTDDGGGCFYSYYQASIDIDSYLPAGFRVAKYADWNTLISSCGPTAGIGDRFRVPGTTWWRSPNTGAVDAYGFKALGAGRLSNAGSWENRLDAAHIWAPAPGNSPSLRFAYIFANLPNFVQVWGGSANERLSVRIIGTAPPSGFSGVFPSQSGAWRNASEVHVVKDGVWRKANRIFVPVSGAWREVL